MFTSKATLMREQFTGISIALVLSVEMRDRTVTYELETYARNYSEDMDSAESSFAAWAEDAHAIADLIGFDNLLDKTYEASVVLALLPYQDGRPMPECMHIARRRIHTGDKLRYAVE